MSTAVARMTKDELQEMIGAVVEQKLIELFGDPDEGLTLKKCGTGSARSSNGGGRSGERGERLEDVVRRWVWNDGRVSGATAQARCP